MVTVSYHLGKLNKDKIGGYLKGLLVNLQEFTAHLQVFAAKRGSLLSIMTEIIPNHSQKSDFGPNGPKRRDFGPICLGFWP